MVKTALSEVFITVFSGIGEVAGVGLAAGLMVGVIPRAYCASATKKRPFKTANIKTKAATKIKKNLFFTGFYKIRAVREI